MKPGTPYIGTSGWNYKHWREVFYPRGVKQADWLDYLAQRLNSAEVNYSFYRIPRRGTVENWVGQVPPHFRFAVKLWRGITQYKKLRGSRHYIEAFFENLEPLPSRKRGPLLVQLPPVQGPDLDKLDAFLDEVREVTGAARWKVAVEFRNDKWLRDDVYKLLDRQRAALCLHDMLGRGAATEPNDASFVYVRRHGPAGAKYHGRYTEEHIRDDARRIRQWLKAGKTVYVYYNNDIGGHAVDNARQLSEALDLQTK